MLHLHGCTGFSLAVASKGYSLVAGQGLLLRLSVGSRACRNSGGAEAQWAQLPGSRAQAQWLRGMLDLPGPGTKPTPPALPGRLFTTEPPERTWQYFCVLPRPHFSSPVSLRKELVHLAGTLTFTAFAQGHV